MERNSALKEHYRRFLVDALEICRDELSKGIVLLTEVPPYDMFLILIFESYPLTSSGRGLVIE